MSKAKTFDKGEVVEVQRMVGGPWLTCDYVEPVSLGSKARYHRVRGDALKHYIDSMHGHEVFFHEDNPRAHETIVDIVPSCRIRKVRAR